MKITKQDLQYLLNDVNYLLNRNFKTLEINTVSNYPKIRDIKTGKIYFREAKTKKEMYLCLDAFREGLFLTIDK